MRRIHVAAVALALILAPVSLVGFAQAGSAPPPTPVPPRGSLSPFPVALRTPADATVRPDVTAPVALLADAATGQVMYAKAPRVPRPIASVTKIMTALLVLEHTQLDDMVTISSDAVFDNDDYGASSTLGLRAGERLTVRDLMYALMLQSANDAADALAIHVAGNIDSFVTMMNRRAAELGMRGTELSSPSGLDDRGRSTAHDLIELTRTAFSTPGFAPIVATKMRNIDAPRRVDVRHVQNRDALLWLYPGAIGVKTGSTAVAGNCLVAAAERDGRRLIAVILGAPSDAFSDAAALMDYGFDAFDEVTFVEGGAPVGELRIRGGIVPVVAGAAIDGLVPAAQGEAAERRLVADPRAAFPPAPGQPVGTLRITIPGLTLGTVALIASGLSPPDPGAQAPWWVRASATVSRGLLDAVGGLFG